MKKITKIIYIILLISVFAAALALTACKPTPVEDAAVTATVHFGLQGASDVTFSVKSGESFLDQLNQVAKPATELEFDGYYLNGTAVTAQTLAPAEDFTVTAKWLASYTVRYYLEQADGSFAEDEERTQLFKGALGSEVQAEIIEISGYVFDESAQNVTQATLGESGAALKLYYKAAIFTLTFDKGYATSATGSMSSFSGKSGASYVIPQCGFVSQAEFVEFNTKNNGTGTSYKPGDSVTLTEDVTLYAVWQATVTQETWLEKDDVVGEYVRGETESFKATVGQPAIAKNPDESKYETDSQHEGSVNTGRVGETGFTLKVYYKLRSFTIIYADDGATQTVRWGGKFIVRTPENADPASEVISYCSSSTGNGRDYPFGAEIVITSDLTLYPVIIDVYADDAGSGDAVKLRRNMTGRGAATLVHSGKEYEGYVNVNEDAGTVEFEVALDDSTVYGRVYNDDAGNNLFTYRGEEAGAYIYVDPLYYDEEGKGYPNPNVMLVLDGYGAAVLAMPEENTERVENFMCVYESTSEGDYYLYGIMPATGEEIEMYFSLVPQSLDVGEGVVLDGYFMQFGEEGYYALYYYYNLEIDDSYMMMLDGYGNGELYNVTYDPDTDEPSLELIAQGVYFYANYFDESDPEMIFWPDNGDPFYFIWQELGEEGYEGIGLFSIRHNEQGEYAHADGTTPSTLYLDGYNGAYFSAEGNIETERACYYTITPTDKSAVFTLIATFIDDDSRLAFEINVNLRTFRMFDDGFVVVDGVLTEYLGTSSVIEIPEGVTEIAANVFNGKDVTFVTFPTTLKKIGDHAFQNSSVSGASALKTVYFKSATPPELGEDVFRWIKGNFKIYVPDGAEEAYRKAFATATPSQPQGYGQFVTSQAEQANKPLYEIVDGVLVSYNNKDVNPVNVTVDIPAEVTEIADGVFLGLDYIVAVNLNNVVVIGANAFRGCVNLGSVTFNPATESVGAYAFYECALTKISFGSVQSIGELAFARNFGLVSVSFDGAVGSIGSRAFYECGRVVSEDEMQVSPLEFVITFASDVPPVLEGLPFDGVLSLRVYVPSYETGIAYAENPDANWARYSTALRVKAASAELWYSKSNAAAVLELGDRIMFDEYYFGLYKREGNIFSVVWFEYSQFTLGLTVIENRLTIQPNGEMTGMDVTDVGDSETYVFVKGGTTLTYKGVRDPSETLEITFGSASGKYCGVDVPMDYSNYRTHFTYDGYVYTVSMNNDCTFSYTRSKITVERTYTAADGSTITIYDGDIIQADGCLKNVDGIAGADGNGLSTTTRGWYLTELGDDAYMFRVMWRNDSYVITVRISGSTFTYTWELASSIITYRDSSTDDIAIVTKTTDGTVTSIHILFKTSNGSVEVNAQFESAQGSVFVLTIVSEEAEEFNGTYKITLNEADKTFTLVRQ